MKNILFYSVAHDSETNGKVAIKKVLRPFDDIRLANLAYRELCMLKFVNHDNLLKLLDVYTTATTPEKMQDLFVFLKKK